MRDELNAAAPDRRFGWRTALAVAIVVVLTPATIVAGGMLGASPYLVSAIVVAYALVPFFVSFENRRPQAREVVVVAVLVAIAVAARAVFFFAPQFKPVVGIAIIAGVSLGAQTGFLVGSMSALVSDFLFGQGPWTPWQMLSWGIAGFFFGLLADRGLVPRGGLSRAGIVALAAGGAVFTVAICGPILDTNSLLMMMTQITPASAAAVYLAGVPMNAVFAVCTFLTILFAGNPLFEKLDRVKVKYGMMEPGR